MSYALDYRPASLDEVVGQDTVVNLLGAQIEEKTLLGQIMLFAGASGSGKTTCARIFAKAMNDSDQNIFEIDAASHNGVDDVRAIINGANTKPIGTPYKVYILDEVQKLSSNAWDALLKLIEQPPSTVIMILCTTELHKVPETVQSRVQRYQFKRLNKDDMWVVADRITDKEDDLMLDDYTFELLYRYSQGNLRTFLNALEQRKYIESDNCVPEAHTGIALILFLDILEGKKAAVLQTIDRLNNRGDDLSYFFTEFTDFLIWFIYMYYADRTTDDNDVESYLFGDEEDLERLWASGDDAIELAEDIVADSARLASELRYHDNAVNLAKIRCLGWV